MCKRERRESEREADEGSRQATGWVRKKGGPNWGVGVREPSEMAAGTLESWC